MTSAPISRAEAVQRLRALEPDLRSRGIRSLHLFGSMARDDAGADSDVDVFAEFEPTAQLGWRYAGAPRVISAALKRHVDFVSRSTLHPLLRGDIGRQAIRIF